jgi:hypothetical protein
MSSTTWLIGVEGVGGVQKPVVIGRTRRVIVVQSVVDGDEAVSGCI